jgi:site-specific recombinase XerD
LLSNFEEHLRALKYAEDATMRINVGCVRHFLCWLNKEQIEFEQVTDAVIERFAEHQCHMTIRWWRGRPNPRLLARIRRFIRFAKTGRLVRSDALLTPPEIAPDLADFQNWLRHHRGLSERVIHRYGDLVMRMVPALGDDPATYDAHRIRGVILDQAQKCSRSYLTMMRTALRGYLRFLITRGKCKPSLDQAVPIFAHWRLSSLPRYLTDPEIERVIQTCKTDTASDFKVTARPAAVALGALTMAGRNNQDVMAR